jgi:hypothetical protein
MIQSNWKIGSITGSKKLVPSIYWKPFGEGSVFHVGWYFPSSNQTWQGGTSTIPNGNGNVW